MKTNPHVDNWILYLILVHWWMCRAINLDWQPDQDWVSAQICLYLTRAIQKWKLSMQRMSTFKFSEPDLWWFIHQFLWSSIQICDLVAKLSTSVQVSLTSRLFRCCWLAWHWTSLWHWASQCTDMPAFAALSMISSLETLQWWSVWKSWHEHPSLVWSYFVCFGALGVWPGAHTAHLEDYSYCLGLGLLGWQCFLLNCWKQ